MSHIFLSYSKDDIEFARHLRDLLEGQGFGVWMDEARLMPAERWWSTIEHNIDTCAAFVVVMSPQGQPSAWIEREILRAEAQGKPIFPVLLAGEGWSRLADVQYDDMRAGMGASLSPRLVMSLAAHAPTERAATLPPPLPDRSTDQPLSGRFSRKAVIGAVMIAAAVAIAIMLGVLLTGDGNGPHLGDRLTLDGVTFDFVPEGCFLRGSTDTQIQAFFDQCDDELGVGECDIRWFDDEDPAREICLSSFWIAQTPVTHAQYRACVDAEACSPPNSTSRFGKEVYDDHPVAFVSWDDATAYAAWLSETTGYDVRLPTEAQWEYAAAGPKANRYPWGNEDATCALANLFIGRRCFADTSPVDTYLNSASWVGALDMSGNVWEWVADNYHEAYYDTVADGTWDPPGPTVGAGGRVLRGGSYESNRTYARAASRFWADPTRQEGDKGFRVAVFIRP